VALGGILPEFIYCGLAVYWGGLLLNNKSIALVFTILFIIVLTVLGLVYFFKKPGSTSLNSSSGQENIKLLPFQNFFKGFSLAFLNPQLLPFWVFVMVYFNSVSFLAIKSNPDKLAYIAGAGFGALVLLIAITETITSYKQKMTAYLSHKYYNKTMALLFFAIAIHQIIKSL